MKAAPLIAALLFAPAAFAQTAADPAAPQTGEALYKANCAICHKADGTGTTDVFPGLAGNENLADAELIVTNIHQGVAIMPPFPTLTDADIAAIATYVRASFGNAHPAVTEAEVAATRATLDPPAPVQTIWDGVFTQAQADRGKAVVGSPCGLCHGKALNGVPDDQDMQPAPPLARAKFLRNWDGRSLGALYSYTRWTMPKSNPGFLPEEDYAAIIAHMLATSGAPAGQTDLPADPIALGSIQITPAP